MIHLTRKDRVGTGRRRLRSLAARTLRRARTHARRLGTQALGALAIACALSLTPLIAPAEAHHEEVQAGLRNAGLLPGSTGLNAPLGDRAPEPQETSAAAATKSPLRVYVVVVDGLLPQEVGPLTPTLSDMRGRGTWYEQARSVLPAETLPNHAAMMSGVLPERNGIVANQFFRGQGPKEYMQYPEFWDADTLVTRLERAYGGGVSTATVLSKEYLFGLFRGENAGPGDPLPQREADFHWDPRTSLLYIPNPSTHSPDATTMDAFLAWVREQRESPLPQFGFLNLGDVDRAGHADEEGVATAAADRAEHPGEDELSGTHVSPFRQAAIMDADTQIQLLVDELKSTGAWEKSVLIVLSDHGMDWGPQHQVAHTATSNVFVGDLKAAGYKEGQDAANGDYWPVGGGGSELIYVHRKKDVAPMAEILSKAEGVQFVATRERVPALGSPTLAELGLDHPRSPDIEVFLKPGWHSAPDASAGNPLPGNHGHSITQHSTLLVTGGNPLLRDQAESIPGEGGEPVYDPRKRPFASPAGGPGVLSVAPTVSALFGIGEPAGGYDGLPLADAFDPGALELRGGQGIVPRGSDGSQRSGAGRGTLGTSLTANSRRARYREQFTLSGRVEAGPGCGGPLRVTLYKRAKRSKTSAIATSIPVRADGSWSHTLSSPTSATYVAGVQPTRSCEGSLSAPVSLPVSARVELTGACRGSRTVSGRVLPRAPRTKIVLQRLQRGAYRRLASGRLDSGSRFRLRLPSCAGRYRVLWPSQGNRNVSGAATFKLGRGRS